MSSAKLCLEGGIFMKLKKCVVLSICICLCMIFALSVPAFAKTYTAGNTGIKISVSDNMYVFTRETPSDDSKITEIGMTYEGIMSRYKMENIYLEAMDVDSFENIILASVPSDSKNFYDMSRAELDSAISKEKSIYGADGNIESVQLYKSSKGIPFVKLTRISDNSALIYVTVYNDNRITVTYSNYSSEITSGQDAGIKTVIDSMVFPEKKTETPVVETEPEPEAASDAEEIEQVAPESALSEKNADNDSQKSDSLFDKLGIKNVLIIALAALVLVLLLVVIFGKNRRGNYRR